MMDENSIESIECEAVTGDPTVALESNTPEVVASPEESFDGGVDYAAVLDADMAELRAEFPELEELKDIYDLANPVRFGALRDLGLTAKEAYLASGGKRTVYDNRRHLTASVPRTARSSAEIMPRRDLEVARSLFDDMSDSDIQKLYRKVKG